MFQYVSQYPDVAVDSALKKYFEEFYKTSDTPGADEEYANAFTEDATLIMASETVKGKSEILNMRKGMWEHVARRLHKPEKIFPFGPNADEVMIYGTVSYGLKNGKSSEITWAARAHLVKDGGDWKMDLYQVYLDTAAQSASQ